MGGGENNTTFCETVYPKFFGAEKLRNYSLRPVYFKVKNIAFNSNYINNGLIQPRDEGFSANKLQGE